MTLRWKRWLTRLLAVLCVLLVVYTAAGFLLLPLLIRTQLPKFVEKELARRASIGTVHVNPFTLRFDAQDVQLTESDGTSIAAIDELAAALEWKSLVQRTWRFDEIRVTAPHVNLLISADGKFNIAELVAALNREPHAASTGLPRLMIGHLVLERGKVAMHDRRAGYDNSFTPIDLVLDNFSTLPDATGKTALNAVSLHGGTLDWKGEASLSPIRGSGELVLKNFSLPDFGVYLKSTTRAAIVAGKLNATVPYHFAYDNGKLDVGIDKARLGLRELVLAHSGTKDAFATLTRLDVMDVGANLARRAVSIGEVQINGGKLAIRRDAKGALDLANLMIQQAMPVTVASSAKPAAEGNWSVAIKQAVIDKLADSVVDESVRPTLKISAASLGLHMRLDAAQTGSSFGLHVTHAALSLADLTIASGTQAPLRLAALGFADAALDLAVHHVGIGKLYAHGGQLQLTRERNGQLSIPGLLPKPAVVAASATAKPTTPAAGKPWTVEVTHTDLEKFAAEVEDQGTGLKVHLQEISAKLDGASTDLARPVRFNAALQVQEGGRLAAQGTVVPATGAVQTAVQIQQLALAPIQPLLGKYVKLKLAAGTASTQGQLDVKGSVGKGPAVRYAGSADIAGPVLNELDGTRFASWKNVGAKTLNLSVAPNLLEIPDLRLVEPDATMIIESDRRFNAARLLVPQPVAAKPTVAKPPVAKPPAAATVVSAAPASTQSTASVDSEPFPIRIQRMRFVNAKLDFTDLSLRPQFGAKIVELNGVISGLSSSRTARSQIELDGRVNEFGLARIRGAFNPFAPADNTNANIVFKNIDMASTTPYAMKFAGYKIKGGKISLDLQYKVRDSKLEGTNQVVIDNLVLGEHVDSPDALKLPLELAIAILKDSNGRIDLGLPVSGDLRDPQFSYAAIIGKAIGNVLTKIVTAPFRALARLFGTSADQLSAIDFDAGSDRLLPPECEKLKQVAQILSKREQLALTVPGQCGEVADGAAIRRRMVRLAVTKHAGIDIDAGENPGPLDVETAPVRKALRELYVERFGTAELDRQKKAAESAAPVADTANVQAASAKAQLPLLQRVGKLIQGEPQVADASAFYRGLRDRLDREQPLAADVLSALGARRAAAIVAALRDDGVDAARLHASAAEKISSEIGKPVPVKLELAAK